MMTSNQINEREQLVPAKDLVKKASRNELSRHFAGLIKIN